MVVAENTYPELTEAFENVAMHIAAARIIHDYSSNKQDVRSLALDGLPLQTARNLLDAGCGFGFFTLALNGRVIKGSNILGIDRFAVYRNPYLNSCESAGLNGRFSASGINSLYSLPSNSFDLVLCSYALYFFPGMISEISRVLKPSGIFVTITHSENHMKELISFIKDIYKKLDIQFPGLLPCEQLINIFSNINGMPLLKRAFTKIEQKEHFSLLVFNHSNFEDLKTYLLFKRLFFIPEDLKDGDAVFNGIIRRLREKLNSENAFHITKNDTIFICRKPLISS